MPDITHMPPATTEMETLRIFVEYAPVAMAMLDRDLRYVCTSRRWREIAGNPDEPIVGKLHSQVFPNVPQKWQDRHARALRGEILRSDHEALTRGGVTVHVRWEIRPWHDARGAIGGILLFSQDLTQQVLAEERQRDTAALLRDFFEHSPVSMGVVELDGDMYRYLQANAVGARHLNQRSPADLMGKTALEMGRPPESIALWVRNLRQSQIDGESQFEYAFRDDLLLAVTVSPTSSPPGALPRFCFVIRDVTEERRAAALLRDFFAYSPFSMGVMELDGDVHRFVQANQVTADHFGLKTPAEVEGKTPVELGDYAADMALWNRHLKESLKAGLVHFEYTMGSHRLLVYVSPTPAPPGSLPRFCYVIHDVTEERRAAKALAESEERLAFALEATDEGVFDWNLATGRLQVSPRIVHQLGLAPEEITDTLEFWEGLIHQEDIPERRRVLTDHMEGRTEAFGAEFRFRHKDGRYIWFHGRGKIVKRDPEGAPLRIVGTHVNITRRKSQEEELRRAKEAALAALEAKSAFLANVSHEIRTPLTAILGAADILEERDLSPEKHAHFLDIVRRSSRHLMTLINDLLDLSKIEAARMEVEHIPCDVSQTVGELALLMRPRAAAKAIEFAAECPAQLRIATDPTRLRQILVNLLDNAVKFTDRGGKVALRVRCEDSPLAGGRRMVFEFTDTGIGIPEEHQSRLFQPFVQADSSTTRRYGGTGLGLAISRRLARLLGGDIEVRSKVGAGSCFTLWLPLEAPEEAQASPKPPAPGAPNRPRLEARVLLVEDGEDIQLLLAHVLERAGAALEVANDGVRGVAKATRAHAAGGDYDVILMDVQMPGMDGRAAAAQLRKLGIDTPIIALSAAGMEKDRQEALASGCDDFVVKPIDTDRLLEVLRHWIHHRPVLFDV